MLRRMAELEPAPWFMGGYAEEALFDGRVTRPHLDLDWILPRSEFDLRRAQAEELGFSGFETWGEAAPGVPFHPSPLALYQIRVGIAGQGSFGELSERQRESARRLREEFLADVPEGEVEPHLERLA